MLLLAADIVDTTLITHYNLVFDIKFSINIGISMRFCAEFCGA